MIVNGVTLPDIPADVLAEFPYVIIANADLPEIAYIAVVSSKEFVHCSGNLVGFDPEKVITTFGSGDMLTIADGGTEWESMGFPFSEGQFYWDEADVGLDEIGTAQDIYTIDSYDSSTGEYTKSDIWMAANISSGGESPAPKPSRYSIATAILDAVARQIMRLTDSTAKVKPEEFEAKLEGINIQLKELTVTATEEVQTITPPSGVYGFSKVIVEAVEDSGTSGGGGTGEGGEGDDTEPDYVSSDNVIFGTEYKEEEVESGMSEYPTKNGDTITLPNLPAGATYAAIYRPSTTFTLYIASGPLRRKTTSDAYVGVLKDTGTYVDKCITTYNLVTTDGVQSWKQVGAISNFQLSGAIWVSHDVTTRSDGSLYRKADGAPTVLMETKVTAVPLDRPDTYTISGDDLNSIVSLTQQITGTEENMTPSDAIAALEIYADKLATGAT